MKNGMRRFATTGALIATLLCASGTLARPTPEQRCEAAKTFAAGKYAACRQKAGKSLTLQPIPASGVGCGTLGSGPPSLVRDLNPTMRDAADPQIARLCACH
jgi:hypothetical protein